MHRFSMPVAYPSCGLLLSRKGKCGKHMLLYGRKWIDFSIKITAENENIYTHTKQKQLENAQKGSNLNSRIHDEHSLFRHTCLCLSKVLWRLNLTKIAPPYLVPVIHL